MLISGISLTCSLTESSSKSTIRTCLKPKSCAACTSSSMLMIDRYRRCTNVTYNLLEAFRSAVSLPKTFVIT